MFWDTLPWVLGVRDETASVTHAFWDTLNPRTAGVTLAFWDTLKQGQVCARIIPGLPEVICHARAICYWIGHVWRGTEWGFLCHILGWNIAVFFFNNFLCRKVHRIQHVLIQSVPREGLGNGHLSFCSSIINPTFARLSLPHVEPSLLSCTIACLSYFKLVLGLFWKNIHVHYKQQNNSNPESSEQRTSN